MIRYLIKLKFPVGNYIYILHLILFFVNTWQKRLTEMVFFFLKDSFEVQKGVVDIIR